jgi:two-component system, NtrC family, sensor kinase
LTRLANLLTCFGRCTNRFFRGIGLASLLVLHVATATAQVQTLPDTTIVLSPRMMMANAIALGRLDGWIFKEGNSTAWAQQEIDASGWKKLKPSQLSEKMTDKSGKLEGWFRIKILLDTAFGDTPLDFFMNAWAASDVYLDGNLIYTFGNTGANGKPFTEYNPTYKLPFAFNVQKGREHILAIHLVDFLSSLPPYNLKSKAQNRVSSFISITTPAFKKDYLDFRLKARAYRTVWLTANVILCVLFWLLTFLNRNEKNLLLIALSTTVSALAIYCDQSIPTPGISYAYYAFLYLMWAILVPVSAILSLLLILRVFNRRINSWFKISVGLILVAGIGLVFLNSPYPLIFLALLVVISYIYYITISWKRLKGAQWAVAAGILLTFSFGLLLAITGTIAQRFLPVMLVLFTGLFLSFPISLLVYVTMRFKEIMNEVRENAKQVVQLSEEKKLQALNQQRILQEEVNRQTSELRNTLEDLKATQAQLIQSEKMASLGELTAGIAHEIQNPLNFVNNFSEVSSELLDEMKQELAMGNGQQASQIADDVKQNLEKIIHHGKRADGIVKGMLMHSRASSGKKEPTDINVLADEYLRLSYHGLRAKDKTFQAKFETHFDKTIEKINVLPQDIGRVLLNLFTNAFYSVTKKNKQYPEGYEPCVSVTTKRLKDKIEIRVRDNGMGIPQKVMDKIFQPFFTTKPTGEGTGLGLSLSYDIITKGHGGELKAETKEGEFAEFVILLPDK